MTIPIKKVRNEPLIQIPRFNVESLHQMLMKSINYLNLQWPNQAFAKLDPSSLLHRRPGHCGETLPLFFNLAFLQEASAWVGLSSALSLWTRSMSCRRISWHGKLLLQSNFTATSEPLVPLMFWYITLLTCTASACYVFDKMLSRNFSWILKL